MAQLDLTFRVLSVDLLNLLVLLCSCAFPAHLFLGPHLVTSPPASSESGVYVLLVVPQHLVDTLCPQHLSQCLALGSYTLKIYACLP